MAAACVALWVVCVLRVTLATIYFQEEFLDGERWRNRWVQSSNDSQFGHFRLSSGKFYGHKEKDKDPSRFCEPLKPHPPHREILNPLCRTARWKLRPRGPFPRGC